MTIRITLKHGDRALTLDADVANPKQSDLVVARNVARELWAVVIAAGPAPELACPGPPTCRPDTECPTRPHTWEPSIEAGGMGFSADLAHQRTYPRPAPDLVPGVTGDPQWDPEDDGLRASTPEDSDRSPRDSPRA